jgi:HAD superfamily hydrolase (TIGR01490 family)
MALVLIDLDGTLIGGLSSEPSFFGFLLRRGIAGRSQIGASLCFVPRAWRDHGRQSFKKNKAFLAGLPVDAVREQAEIFVLTRLLPRVREVMRERIDWHRRQGDTLCLLTGAGDFIAAPLADLLDIPVFCAARCAAMNGVFTAAAPEYHPIGMEKLNAARQIATGSGEDLADAIAYGDSALDVPLLRAVGRPVAVNPSRALRRIAGQEGWEILDSRAPAAPRQRSARPQAQI